MQFEERAYQQIFVSSMKTNCAHLIDLFLYCNEMGFMSYLHTSKKLDLVDMFDNTS